MIGYISYDDEFHDAIVTSPFGGYFESIKCAVLGGCVEGGISVPAYAPISTAVCQPASCGRNSVRATAVSDLASGAVRACHGSGTRGGGTSIILEIDADMPMTTMARAAITAMEAVTCVLQDLDVRDADGEVCSGCSNLSIAVIRDRGSDLCLRGAGKHSKLGQMIGESVYMSVMESALLNGRSPRSADGVIGIMGRVGVTPEHMFRASGCGDRMGFQDAAEIVSSDEKMIALVSSIVSLSDQIRWGLVPKERGIHTGRSIISSVTGIGCESGDDLIGILTGAISMYISSKVE